MPISTPDKSKSEIKSYPGGADAFTSALLYTPQKLRTPTDYFNKLFGVNFPRNVNDFVALLSVHERNILSSSIYWPSGQTKTVVSNYTDLIAALDTSDRLKEYLRTGR